MNDAIKELGFPSHWFTGKKITLGEQVLLEVDVRHFSPPGWSTYKFMNADKAAEFAAQWGSKGGLVLVGKDVVGNELVGSRDLYYVYAGPIQSFYGKSEDETPSKTESCLTLGLAKKPRKRPTPKASDKAMASQGTFSDFYEAVSKDKVIKLTGEEAFVLRAVLFDAFHSNDLKALASKFNNEIDGWKDSPETLHVNEAQHKELRKVLESFIQDAGFMKTFFRTKGSKKAFLSAARKCGANTTLTEAASSDGKKEAWQTEVADLMKKTYGLDPGDYDSSYDPKMTPQEYVEWYGEKYDLDELDPDGKKTWGL